MSKFMNIPVIKGLSNSVEIEKGVVHLTVTKKAFYRLFVKTQGDKKANALFKKITTRLVYSFEFYEFFLPIIIKGIDNAIEIYNEDTTPTGRIRQRDIPALRFVRTLLIENTWLKDTYREEPFPKQISMDVIHQYFNWKPLPHQQVAIDAHSEIKERFGLRGMYIDGAIGSGKTVLSLMMAYGQEPDHIVVFAPNSTIKDVWEKTLTSEAFKIKQPCWVVKGIAIDKNGIRKKEAYKNQRVILANFESAFKLKSIVQHLNGKIVYIVDEAHSLNDKNSRTSQLIQDYVTTNNPDDVILMSGTPLKMKQTELIPLITILDPKFTPVVRRKYEIIFRGGNRVLGSAIPDIYARYRVVVKPKSTDDSVPPQEDIIHKVKVKNEENFYISKVRDDMDDYVERRVKEDKPNILKMEKEYRQLRDVAFERLSKTVPVNELKRYEYEVEQVKKQYKGTRKDNYFDLLKSVREFESQVIEPILDSVDRKRFRVLKTMYKYPMLKYLGEALGTIVTQARIEASLAIVDGVNVDNIIDDSEKKVLVFANYIKVANRALRSSKKYRGVGIYGESAHYLQQALAELENDKFDYIVSTYRVLGTGVPVTMCSTTIAFEKPFRDYLWKQALGRTHRQGQTSRTYVYTFEMDTGEEPNIYNRTEDLLTESRWNVKYLTSGTSIVDDITKESEEIWLNETTVDYYNSLCKDNGFDEFDLLNEEFNFNNKGCKMALSREELNGLSQEELVNLAEEFNDDVLLKRVKSLSINTLYKDRILSALEDKVLEQEFIYKEQVFESYTNVEPLQQPVLETVEHEVLPYLEEHVNANLIYETLHQAVPILNKDIDKLEAIKKEIEYLKEHENIVLYNANKIVIDNFKVLSIPTDIRKQEFTLEAEDFKLERYEVTCELLNEIGLAYKTVSDKKGYIDKYLPIVEKLDSLRASDEYLVNLRNAFCNVK